MDGKQGSRNLDSANSVHPIYTNGINLSVNIKDARGKVSRDSLG